MPLDISVEIEEEIYAYEPADNGAGPLWCHGSTIVARHRDAVYLAALETLPEQQPLNNSRFLLYRRDDDGWHLIYRDESGRTREPSPVVMLDGELLVSANPTLTAPGEYGGPPEPTVFRFGADDSAAPPIREQPQWQGKPAFTEHSYRTVAADGMEVLYMQNTGYETAQMSFRDEAGQWYGLDPLTWPWGGEYDPPQPLRLCYPNVALHERSAHFIGVGDIVEPITAWRDAKLEITGREWDYVFRRLFYAYTPDVTAQPFGEWIEIANRDQTAGHIRNGDLHLDADGLVHILWTESNLDHRLRDRFFPDQQIAHTLEYLTLREGQIQTRRTLVRAVESERGPIPKLARFHILADGTPIILGQFSNLGPDAIYRCTLLSSDPPDWVDIPFSHPMPDTFLTNTVRAGSAPSPLIDIVGMRPDVPNTLGYARVRIEISD